MSNNVIPTGKVSFDELKNSSDNIATRDNIIQDGRAALNEEWSQEGGPQVGPPIGSPCQDKGKCNIFTLLSRFSLITIELEPDILYINGVPNDNCDALW